MDNALPVTPETTGAPDWRALLAAEVEARKKEGGKAAVAIRLGVSRSYVSRALSTGSSGYAKVPEEFVKRVIDRLYVIRECPVTLQPRPVTDCQRINTGPAPTHNPIAMMTWRKCQECPFKPSPEAKP